MDEGPWGNRAVERKAVTCTSQLDMDNVATRQHPTAQAHVRRDGGEETIISYIVLFTRLLCFVCRDIKPTAQQASSSLERTGWLVLAVRKHPADDVPMLGHATAIS